MFAYLGDDIECTVELYECSECGAKMAIQFITPKGTQEPEDSFTEPQFCPNCGKGR